MEKIKISRSGDNFSEGLKEALKIWPVVARMANGSSGHRFVIFVMGRSGGLYWAYNHTSTESVVCWGSTPDEAVEQMYHQSQEAKSIYNRLTGINDLKRFGFFSKLTNSYAKSRLNEIEPGLLENSNSG